MRTIKNSFAILLIAIFVTSCSSINIKPLDTAIIDRTVLYDLVTSAELTEDEISKVDFARNTYIELRDKWVSKIKDGELDIILISNSDLMKDYNLLVNQYNIVMNITMSNISEYSTEEINRLGEFSDEFSQVYHSIEGVKDTVEMAKIFVKLIKVAAPLLLP